MSALADSASLASQDTPEDILPGYSPAQSSSTAKSQLVTHSYSLARKDGRVWLQLIVQSRAASSDQPPVVLGSQTIQGTVEYGPNLKQDPKPKSISILIVGELVSEQNAHFSFVEVSQDLWPNPLKNSATTSKADGVAHILPFSLQLPETVKTLAEDKTIKSFKLPAIDYARFRRYTVIYTLRVKVRYGSIFRPNHELETRVNYIPLIQPPPPSPLRQKAYTTNTPIPPPDVDPDGWHSLTPITFEGKLFGDSTINVQYTLSVAKPLSYTSGSVAPLHMLVECSDVRGLDLASAPSAPLVRFRRIAHNNYDAGGCNVNGERAKLIDLKPLPMASLAAFYDIIDWLKTATWWSTPCEKSGARALQGEIHLPKNTRPSALLGFYKLSYDVAMFEPSIPGFVLSNAQKDKDKVLQSVEVEVATAYAPGPRPIAYSPPNYDDESLAKETGETRFLQFN